MIWEKRGKAQGEWLEVKVQGEKINDSGEILLWRAGNAAFNGLNLDRKYNKIMGYGLWIK